MWAVGRVLVVSSVADVTVLSAHDVSTILRKEVGVDDDVAVFPGGIAVDAGVVYAATGVGEAMALAAEDGRELWRVGLPAPVRGSPTGVKGQVYVEIGRASCRARVCQYGYSSVVAVSLKKKCPDD